LTEDFVGDIHVSLHLMAFYIIAIRTIIQDIEKEEKKSGRMKSLWRVPHYDSTAVIYIF
jgi:hypothetical protein